MAALSSWTDPPGGCCPTPRNLPQQQQHQQQQQQQQQNYFTVLSNKRDTKETLLESSLGSLYKFFFEISEKYLDKIDEDDLENSVHRALQVNKGQKRTW